MANKNPSPENQFKKGVAPNPGGRPKKENTYSDTLRSLLVGQEIKVTWTIDGKKKEFNVSSDKNLYYGIASAQIMEALKGNVQAQKEIVDRIQGKAPQALDVTTQGDKVTSTPLTKEQEIAISRALKDAENNK